MGATTLDAQLIPGQFPNYEGLIPDDHTSCVRLPSAECRQALARVSLMAVDSAPVRVKVTQSEVSFAVVTMDVGESEETLAHDGLDGDEFEAAFNPTYLREGLEAVGGDTDLLRARDKKKPVVMTPDDDGDEYLYLLMPVSVG